MEGTSYGIGKLPCCGSLELDPFMPSCLNVSVAVQEITWTPSIFTTLLHSIESESSKDMKPTVYTLQIADTSTIRKYLWIFLWGLHSIHITTSWCVVTEIVVDLIWRSRSDYKSIKLQQVLRRLMYRHACEAKSNRSLFGFSVLQRLKMLGDTLFRQVKWQSDSLESEYNTQNNS